MATTRLLNLRHLCSKLMLQPAKPPSPTTTTRFSSLLISSRSYIAEQRHRKPRPGGRAPDSPLYTRISLLGSSTTTVTPLLDHWVDQGNRVHELDLRRIIRLLRSRNRYSQALEVSEWMSTKKLCPFLATDNALKLNLIGKVRGIEAAEKYFKEVEDKSERIHGSLLNCYVRESLVEKALSHFEAMKKSGIAKFSLSYNSIMNLYVNTGQLEKVPDLLAEMKRNGILPDEISYKICIKAYGLKCEFEKMEMVLKEMECQPHIIIDSSTFNAMATFYMKAGLNDKVLQHLKSAESKANGDQRSFRYLITMYASLGETFEVLRLWRLLKSSHLRLVNVDYMNVMTSLLKLGEFEEAEKIFTDWETSAKTLYDFRVPNALLLGYTRKGLAEKAEEMLRGIVESGRVPTPNSWSIVAAGYMDKQDMKRALECMKKALASAPQHPGWLPKPDMVSSILKWLGDEGDVQEVEEFVKALKQVVAIDRDMYHALIKANIRHGNEVDAILQSMKGDNIDEDEETKTILSL